jgi:PAS domain S-box-containing protein
MKTNSFPTTGLIFFSIAGLLLWVLLRFGKPHLSIPFLPEIVLAIFLITGVFIFFLLRHFLKTRSDILKYDKALRKKDEIYELVASGLNDGVWDWDFKTGSVYFSQEWLRMLDYTGHAKNVGMRSGISEKEKKEQKEKEKKASEKASIKRNANWWASRVHPEDISSVKQHMDLHFSGKTPFYEAQYRVLTGSNVYVWILDRGQAVRDAKGTLTHMAGITSNIQNLKHVETVLKSRTSELEQAKESIEAQKARTETVLESIGEGVVAVDKSGVVTIANPAGANMLGLSKEEMIGTAFVNIVPKEEDRHEKAITKEERLVYQTLKTGEKFSASLFYYRKDEAKFPAAVTSAPIILDGTLSGAIVVFRDITREMEIDQQKTEFVSLASHQLRTPLSAIRWYSEMVLNQRKEKLTEKQERYVREIYESNLRMIELVNALLNVSRIELGTFAVEPKELDLGEMFESVVDELMPAMQAKGLHFTKHYEDAPKAFYVDPNLMRIVFQNLLSNSVKYTPDNGHISIAVSENGNYLRVEVKDDGYGIPKADQPKMFSKLFRADNVKSKDTEGTGLGLYIINSVVEKSCGRIWFESEEDKGTTFFVELPMAGMKMIEGTKGLEA